MKDPNIKEQEAAGEAAQAGAANAQESAAQDDAMEAGGEVSEG